MSIALPDPHRTRRAIGATLFVLGVLVGGGLLAAIFLLPPLSAPDPLGHYGAMILGGVLAFPAGAMYLTVPRLLDRYDPEPAYALFGCLLWGGLAACGFSAAINTGAVALAGFASNAQTADAIGAVVSAPLVEEAWKGLGVLGVFYFLHREFDGVVDGIIYATFVALGFAAVENVVYYASATTSGGGEALAATFVLRGLLAPWGHPLYTSMTGIGLGIARETTRPWLRIVAPVGGYSGAVLLHMIWNGTAVLGSAIGPEGGLVFLLLLPLWFLFVLAFLVMVLVLVRRRGQILRQYLVDEVALKTIDARELELVCSAFGLLRARLRHGPRGAEFVRAAARLALSKWHATRAMKSKAHTVSFSFIGPLRQRIAELRGTAPRS